MEMIISSVVKFRIVLLALRKLLYYCKQDIFWDEFDVLFVLSLVSWTRGISYDKSNAQDQRKYFRGCEWIRGWVGNSLNVPTSENTDIFTCISDKSQFFVGSVCTFIIYSLYDGSGIWRGICCKVNPHDGVIWFADKSIRGYNRRTI